jgi:hypothetical protein
MNYTNDHTTGPEVAGLNEDALPSCAGATATWTISSTRTVQNCRFVGTRIVVTAPNVVLRNMVILGNAPYIVEHRSTGLLIENSIVGPKPGAVPTGPQTQPCSASVGDADYTIRKSEIFGCADGLKVRNSVAVWSSYFHDLYKGCGSPGDCTHNDTVQFIEGQTLRSLVFRGNAAYADACTSNRHFQLKNARNATFDIRNNFFYGMSIINIDGTAGGNTGVMNGNIYAGRQDSGPFQAKADGSSMSPSLYTGVGLAGIAISSNRFENGAPVPANGIAAPYRCVAG